MACGVSAATSWGDNSVSSCMAYRPKVLALVQERYLWRFPYLERIQGVLDGVPTTGPVGPPADPSCLELAALAGLGGRASPAARTGRPSGRSRYICSHGAWCCSCQLVAGFVESISRVRCHACHAHTFQGFEPLRQTGNFQSEICTINCT